MSIQKKSSFSLASFLEKLPGDFFSHPEVQAHVSPTVRGPFWNLEASCFLRPDVMCRKTTTTTATCLTTETRRTGRRTLWLNLASCSSERSLNSEEVSTPQQNTCRLQEVKPSMAAAAVITLLPCCLSVFKWVRKTLIALVQVTFGRTINK